MTEPRAMTGRVTLGNGEVRELASPMKRLLARIVDLIILGIAFLILAAVGVAAWFLGGESDLSTAAVLTGIGALVFYQVMVVIYEPTMLARRGQTLGKMMLGVKVVRADDGEVPGWGKAIGRWILPGLLSLIPIVGSFLSLLVWVSLIWDDRRQGWHDKVATTVVVKV